MREGVKREGFLYIRCTLCKILTAGLVRIFRCVGE